MLNVAMWGKALTAMPRIDKDVWDDLDIISRWLIATRFAVAIMTFTSAAFAGLLAAKAGEFHLGLWLLVTLGLCFAHATNNLVNDLTDYWKGVDKDNYFRTQYGPQPVEAGLLSVRQMVAYIVVTGAIALAAGLYLVMETDRSQITLLLLGLGAFFVLFYTFPLKYIGMGEPAVLLVWGPLMVGGGYFVITGQWSNEVALASIAYALAPTGVLFGKHIDKIDADRDLGIRTLPVLLGEAAARRCVVGMFLAQYFLIAWLIVTGFFSPVLAVVLLALPSLKRVWETYREPRPEAPPAEFKGVWPLWFVAASFWYTRRFGGLFLLGLIADVAIARF